MVETSKPKGFVLVTALLVMILMLALAFYASSFSIDEMNIANSQQTSVQTYYLAESGVAEAIWRIKNDSTWKTSFVSSSNWTMDYTHNAALYPNGSYRIQIANSGYANGAITVTANLNYGLFNAKRVIKTTIYKALGTGTSTTTANGEYAANSITMSNSIIHVFASGIFSNNSISISSASIINVDQSAQAVNQISVDSSSHLIASSSCDSRCSPAPKSIPLPAVSFSNTSDPNSYISQATRANQVYDSNTFANMITANQGKTLTLNGVVYVTNNVSINGNINLVINGALVAANGITIGGSGTYCSTTVTVNRTSTTTASGILSQNGLDFQSCLKGFTGNGLFYASNGLNITNLPNQINITGAIMGANGLNLSNDYHGVNIIYNDTTVGYGLGDPQFSSIVTINHWEEEY